MHFRTASRAIVIALAYVVLQPQGPLEDPLCPKREWGQGDVDALHDFFRTEASLAQIAGASARDQLSVAFRLFTDRLPGVTGVVKEIQTA